MDYIVILFCYSYKQIFWFLKKFAKTSSDVVCLLNFSAVVGNVWFEEKLANNFESEFFQIINIAEHCKVCISFGEMKSCSPSLDVPALRKRNNYLLRS